MKHEKLVKLERQARKSGGDRYEAEDGFMIYIPQAISRPDDKTSSIPEILITFETRE